jgi:hypothetical protein
MGNNPTKPTREAPSVNGSWEAYVTFELPTIQDEARKFVYQLWYTPWENTFRVRRGVMLLAEMEDFEKEVRNIIRKSTRAELHEFAQERSEKEECHFRVVIDKHTAEKINRIVEVMNVSSNPSFRSFPGL